jgi:hypothetical protein
MKELVGNSANIFLLETTDSQLVARAEVVFLVSEPKYQTDGAGGFVKTRTPEDFRFSVSMKWLREVAGWLNNLADQCEDIERRASIEPGDS